MHVILPPSPPLYSQPFEEDCPAQAQPCKKIEWHSSTDNESQEKLLVQQSVMPDEISEVPTARQSPNILRVDIDKNAVQNLSREVQKMACHVCVWSLSVCSRPTHMDEQ